MPRRERLFFEGGFFHVYNRLGRGEHAFRDEETARFFTERKKVPVTLLRYCVAVAFATA